MLMVVTSIVLGGCADGERDTPAMNAAELIHEITVSSDSLLVSDLYLADPGLIHASGTARWQVTCDAESCVTHYPEPLQQATGVESAEETAETFHDNRHTTEAERSEVLNGVSLGAHSGGLVTDLSFVSYGGWMKHSLFGTDLVSVAGVQRYGYAFSLGSGTGSNPLGDATWKGAMVGNLTQDSRSGADDRGHLVQGNATVTFRLADATLDVALTDIADVGSHITQHAPHPHERHPDMLWETLEVRDGRFMRGSDGDSIQGQFYGPNHEEVGGIFERGPMAGAFGAKQP